MPTPSSSSTAGSPGSSRRTSRERIARFLAEPTTLAVLLGLYLLEFFADKIPGLDHVWDVVHTVVRPVGRRRSSPSRPWRRPPKRRWRSWPAAGAGVTALAAHLVKGTVRLTSTALTAGVANFALSLAEDILAVLQAIVSIFLPLVALVLAIAVAGLFLLCVPKLARGVDLFARRRRRKVAWAGRGVSSG